MSLHTLFKNLTRKAHRPRKNTRRRLELDTLEGKALMSGLVQGYVTGPDHLPISGAVVTLASDPSNPSISYNQTRVTNSDGYYTFDNVPAGPHYTLSESANGYVTSGATFREMFNQNAAVSATTPKTIGLDVVDLDQQTLMITFGVAPSTQSAYVWNPGIDNGDGTFGNWEGTSSGGYNITYTTTDSNNVSTTTTLPVNCMDPYHNVSPTQSYQVYVSLQTLSNNPVAGGAATLGEVGWLSNHYGGPSANLSATDSSGLQLAIWALLKDGAPALEASIAQNLSVATNVNYQQDSWGSDTYGVADTSLPLHVSTYDAAIASANNFILMASGHSEHAYFLNSGYDIQGQLAGGDGGIQGQLVGGNTQGQGVFGDEYDFQNDMAPLVVTPPPPVVTTGTTATIGFWDGPNGKKVITSAPGGSLAQWLTANFPNLYGSAKLTDSASVYKLFDTYKNANGTKTNAQVMATALAIYFSDPTIGQTATSLSFGFTSSVAKVSIDVSKNAAFGDPTGKPTSMTVWDLLKATNDPANTLKGVIFGGKGAKWTAVNDVFDSINQKFDTP
jgi:hypothetical protein